jgi:hypothetical protein
MKKRLLLKYMLPVLAVVLAVTAWFGAKQVAGAVQKLESIEAFYVGPAVEVGKEISKKDIFLSAVNYISEGQYGYYDYEEIKSGFSIYPSEIKNKGDNQVVVTYREKSCVVTVPGKVVESITADYLGDELYIGATVPAGKVEVYAYFSDGSFEKVRNFVLSSTTVEKAGLNTISVVYNGKVANVFVYGKEDDATIADRVTYTVICIDDLTGKTLQEKVYEGDIDTYITCTAPEITRYYPYDEEQTLYLSEDETDNIVYFYYEEIADDYEMIIPDENILYYNEHAYYVMCSSDINSFWEAQSYCEESGGYLAIINDENENKALYDYVFNDMGYRSSYFGFTDDGSEGTWYWVGNHDLSNYTNWAKGEPDNQGNVENFALFYYNDTPYKWNDGDFGKDSDGNVYFLIEWDYSVNSTTSQE